MGTAPSGRNSIATELPQCWAASHLEVMSRRNSRLLSQSIPVKPNRGDRRWTFLNDFTGMRLFHAAIALAQPFTAEELQSFGHTQVP
jgi:hypothetical protein